MPVDKQGSNRYMFPVNMHVNMTHFQGFASVMHCCSRVRIDNPANEVEKLVHLSLLSGTKSVCVTVA